MAASTRAPRTRASGGRTLMLLGVLLALAAGTIVIVIVSSAQGNTAQSVMVVMAKTDLPAGTILTVGPSDPAHNTMSISDAFQAKSVSTDYAPTNYLPFVSIEDLNVKLNNQVVVGTFYAGDILRTGDPRLVALGSGAPGSLTNINPARLPAGSVLMTLDLSGSSGSKPIASAGDHIDLLFVGCSLPGSQAPSGCEAQTTLQDLYVYSTANNQIIVVVTHQQALQLVYLMHSGGLQIVVRKPNDDGPVTTSPVDGASIVKQFNF